MDHPNGFGCCNAKCGSYCGSPDCWLASVGADQCCENKFPHYCSRVHSAPCLLNASKLKAVFVQKRCGPYHGIDGPKGLGCCPATCGEYCGRHDCASGPGGKEKCCPANMTTTCGTGIK